MKRHFILCVAAVTILGGCTESTQSPEAKRHGGIPDVGQSQPSKAVSVIRSHNDSPVIRVESARNKLEADKFLGKAQGYTQAQDRFLQMDFVRRAARGRLAEAFGSVMLQKDIDVHAVGLVAAIENSVSKIKEYPEVFAVLVEYAKGVNTYIAEMEQKAPKLLAFYRRITGDPNYKPMEWAPIDTIAIGQSVAFMLSSDLKEKLVYGALALKLGDPKKFAERIVLRPLENISIMQTEDLDLSLDRDRDRDRAPNMSRQNEPAVSQSAQIPAAMEGLSLDFNCSGSGPFSFPMPDCHTANAQGSNNWVVSPQFAGGTSAFLANDPHLALTFPALFYEMALDSKSAGGSIRARGVNVPGIPGILIGHNDYIAWGMTNSMSDVDEVYLETLDEEGTSVLQLSPSGELIRVPLVTRTYQIPVRKHRGKVENKPLHVRWVEHHGPVFSDHMKSVKDALPEGILFSYRWTGHPGTREAVAMFKVQQSTDFASFKEALNLFEAGAQNLIYADRKGNIGYYSHGLFPIRKFASMKIPPYMFVTGTGAAEWSGYRSKFPELYNPESGYIITANNDPYGKNQFPKLSGFQDYFGYGFAFGSRAQRISDLLKAKRAEGPLTADTMSEIQYDHVDLLAKRFRDFLKADGIQAKTPNAEKLKSELLAWDGDMDRDKVVPVWFIAWVGEVLKSWAHDFESEFEYRKQDGLEEKLNAFLQTTLGIRTVYHHIREGLEKGEARYQAIVNQALANASGVILGRAKHKTWGEVHRIDYLNFLEGIFPKVPAPHLRRDGSFTTIDMAGFDLGSLLDSDKADKPLELPTMVGPTMRMVMEIPPSGPIMARNVLFGETGVRMTKSNSWMNSRVGATENTDLWLSFNESLDVKPSWATRD